MNNNHRVTNVQSAIEFILNVDGSMLSCDTEEFDTTLAKNMARLLAEEEKAASNS